MTTTMSAMERKVNFEHFFDRFFSSQDLEILTFLIKMILGTIPEDEIVGAPPNF